MYVQKGAEEEEEDLRWSRRDLWLWELRESFKSSIFRPLFKGLTFSLNSSHSFPVSRFDRRNSVSGSKYSSTLSINLLQGPYVLLFASFLANQPDGTNICASPSRKGGGLAGWVLLQIWILNLQRQHPSYNSNNNGYNIFLTRAALALFLSRLSFKIRIHRTNDSLELG